MKKAKTKKTLKSEPTKKKTASKAKLDPTSQNRIIKLINSSLNIDEVLHLSMKLMEI